MIRQFQSALVLAGALAAVTVRAATTPLYVNSAPVVVDCVTVLSPQIDATAFVNQSVFSVSTCFSGLPYETFNTRFFTNRSSGIISATPGYRFDHFTNNVRRMMGAWVNQGSISANTWLLVSATNIVGLGPLNASPQGLIRLDGRNVNLSRNGIRTGLAPGTFFGSGFVFGTNYVNAPGIEDIYWGVGTNNVFRGVGPAVPLGGASPNFHLPNPPATFPPPSSPAHDVVQPFTFSSGVFTNRVVIPKFSFFDWEAHVFTNQASATNTFIQIVYVPRRNPDTNFQTQVRFFQDFGDNDGGRTVIVEYNAPELDIVSGTVSTNRVYLVDNIAFATNILLLRNAQFGVNTRRPSTLEVTRVSPELFSGFGMGQPAQVVFTNDQVFSLISNPSYLSNSVTMAYAAYAADVTAAGVTNVVGTVSTVDPTNLPGRVEIRGDTLNLDLTRVRAESTVVIKTGDLSSNRVARLDAPFLDLDLTSRQPELVISNLAPSDVNRLFGRVCAWSAIWNNFIVDTNTATTNTLTFHVLFADNFLQSVVPVSLFQLALHATNLVIRDMLQVDKSVLLDAKSLEVLGGLSFPPGSSWGATNVLQLVNFTNRGIINVPGLANYGVDRGVPYSNFVNYGSNTAGAQFLSTRSLFNAGCLNAASGPMSIDARMVELFGPPTVLFTNVTTNIVFDFTTGMFTNLVFTNLFTNSVGAKMAASGDLQVTAFDFKASNSVLIAGAGNPGALILSVTNVLDDEGPGAVNQWSATAGFEVRRLPATSDLIGTWLRTTVPANLASSHTWPAAEGGLSVNGYSNNLALGKLTVDAGNAFSLATFASASGGPGAMYVDYVELLNFATNANTAFAIDPNFTIYFANASVPVEKLDGAAGGRFRWVYEFAGPLSTTNMFYPSDGNFYQFNIARVTSRDLDSDWDGIPNAEDPEPIPVPSMVPIAATLIEGTPRRVMLSWSALPFSTSYIEYKESLTAPAWQTLTNHVQGEFPASVQIYDSTASGRQRIYRLRLVPAF
jgi:hypothetical protein